MTRRLAFVVLVTAGSMLTGSLRTVAQTAATVDVGTSWIDYADYLGSGAFVLTPALRYDGSNTSLGASGSYVRFESGSNILQGLFAWTWQAPRWGRFHGELAGSAGLSVYNDRLAEEYEEESAGFGHFLGRAKIHYSGTRSGAWIGGTVGGSYAASESTTPHEIGIGFWSAYDGIALGASFTRTGYLDVSYVDAVGTVRWRDRFIRIDGLLGLRGWSEGGGAGLYGEIHSQIPVWKRLSVLIAGGRYPSDPTRGVLSANYVSLSMRIDAIKTSRSTSPAPMRALARELERPGRPEPGEARLSLLTLGQTGHTIRVEAPGVENIELYGDFTDWQPIPLRRVSESVWEATLELNPGIYRVNVRLNGGPWMVPKGLRTEEDDFGSIVGVLVVR